MPQDEFRLFLSAVSSEFGKARDALAADLRSRELLLRVQSDFRQEPESDTTSIQKEYCRPSNNSRLRCLTNLRCCLVPIIDATNLTHHA